MKPLLRPAIQPHADLLKNALGISGLSPVGDLGEYETHVDRILNELKMLTSAERFYLEERLDHGDASLRTYVFSVGDHNTGNVLLSYGSNGAFTMGSVLSWPFLPPQIDDVVGGIDRLWESAPWATLYAYDADDYSLQNAKTVCGMEHWGVLREQVDLINRYGVVEEIDTRANPGFMLNKDGFFWSVQWLTYWSAEAQGRILAALPAGLPPGVEARSLPQGGVRLRLGEKPGRLDDVQFHQLQLDCRHSLPWCTRPEVP